MKCRICCSNLHKQAYEALEMMFGYRDAFRYFQCPKCGCLQINEKIPALKKYYPDSYYSYEAKVHGNALKSYLKRSRDRHALFGSGVLGRLLYWVYPRPDLAYLKRLSMPRETRILDVGCGAGALLYSMRDLGMPNLLGSDPFNARDINYDNGLEVQKKTLQDIGGEWDLVMFHHSLEHMSDPIKELEHVHSLLGDRGHCLIRIPVVSSYAWKHYREKWVQLDAPRHLFLPSSESMRVLACKAGFELCDVFYDSTDFQFWGSEQYEKGIPLRSKCSYFENPKASIFSKRDIKSFRKRARELNFKGQGDQAAFLLKKSSSRD